MHQGGRYRPRTNAQDSSAPLGLAVVVGLLAMISSTSTAASGHKSGTGCSRHPAAGWRVELLRELRVDGIDGEPRPSEAEPLDDRVELVGLEFADDDVRCTDTDLKRTSAVRASRAMTTNRRPPPGEALQVPETMRPRNGCGGSRFRTWPTRYRELLGVQFAALPAGDRSPRRTHTPAQAPLERSTDGISPSYLFPGVLIGVAEREEAHGSGRRIAGGRHEPRVQLVVREGGEATAGMVE